MSNYSPFGTGKFASPNKASERVLLFSLLRWYDSIAASILAIIMFLLIWPVFHSPFVYDYLLLLTAFPVAVVGYVCFTVLWNTMLPLLQFAHNLSRNHPPLSHSILTVTRVMNHLRKAKHVPVFIKRGYQACFLIVFVVAFMAIIRQAYVYVGIPVDEGAVWLLYVIPIQHVARAGSLRWLASVCVLTLAAVAAFAHVFDVPLLYDAQRLFLLKGFWLLLICLVPLLLTIYLGDRAAGFLKMRDLIGKLVSIHPHADDELANEIADMVARELKFDYVNIFVVKTSPDASRVEGLRIIGTSNRAGRKLVKEGFTLEASRGVIGSAARLRRFWLVNNVRRDTRNRYVPHDAYKGTKSELALPILFGDTILGVLDIQSKRANAFNRDDVNLLESLTTHLAVVFSAAQNLLRNKGLYAISQKATQRVVTNQGENVALNGVIARARQVLQASSMVLYTRDPLSGHIRGPYTAGIDAAEASPASVVNSNARSRVHEVLRSSDIQFFQASDQEAARTGDGRSGTPRNGPIFAKRFNIKSTVAIPIPGPDSQAGSQLGVIFANYCSERPRGTFTDGDIEWCRSLADITSLVLQSVAHYQTGIRKERIDIGMDIHDGLGQYASFTRLLLEQTMGKYESEGVLAPDDFEKLRFARDASQRLQEEVNTLLNLWREPSENQGLFEWAEKYAALVSQTKLTCAVKTFGNDGEIPVALRHDAEVSICEAVRNADRHGAARNAHIRLRLHRQTLFVRITDDGKGINLEDVKTNGGLSHMQRRVQRWGGRMRVRSQRCAGRGTRITLSFQLGEPGHDRTLAQSRSKIPVSTEER